MEVKGRGGISVKVIADSIEMTNGKRITTFELEYPRFIHAEFMTHRSFSRNAASSRAIPIIKMINQAENNMAKPIHWGKNQPGMQAKEELGELEKLQSEHKWEDAAWSACNFAKELDASGAHKQIVNRILEPYQFIKVVLTSTEFDNFFWLRCHTDAQPEIKELSDCLFEASRLSAPELLKVGEWHTPYVDHIRKEDGTIQYIIPYSNDDYGYGYRELTLEEALKVSSSCCAQVSFRLLNNSLEKACEIYKMLVESTPVHASPFEHQATPMRAFDYITESKCVNAFNEPSTWEKGITHSDRNKNLWSGNFSGWIQHRQLIPDNACWDYEQQDA